MASPGSPDATAIPSDIPAPDTDLTLTYDALEKDTIIGTGGNATVYRVHHPDHDRALAIKEPHIRTDLPADLIDRFRTEAETWAQLDAHDHIVTVHDWDTDPHPWIALEYMDAGNLRDKLDTDIPLAEALWIGVCLAHAIYHAHRHGVAHLDLKPANILFRDPTTDSDSDADTASNMWPVPKVTDWGLAKLLLTHSASLDGLSPRYAAPEQFDTDQYGPPDDYTDLYQLGTVLYELLTDTHPFTDSPEELMQAVLTTTPDPPTTVDASLPADLDAIIDRALAKSKDDRYESVLDLRRDLEAVLASVTDYTQPDDSVPIHSTHSPADTATTTPLPAQPVVDLTTQGFTELTDDYFEHHDPLPPAHAWRAGLSLADVKAGYAINREQVQDGDRINVVTHLHDHLTDGTDMVVLGPPGAGKSTVCKLVATQWYDSGHGPVVYRESDTTDQFDQPGVLTQYLRRADGHPLVVVEDAVHPDANAIFDVLERLGDHDDVAILLDARGQEWDDPTAVNIDARLDTHRQRVLDPLHLAPPDPRECQRLIQHFEQLIDRPINLPRDELVATVTRDSTQAPKEPESESSQPVGDMFLLLHRLTQFAEPLAAEDAPTPTTLVEAVQQTYNRLDTADSTVALDVGVLVNLLNAAELPVYPELLYALAPDADTAAVDDAVAQLEGEVVYGTDTHDGQHARTNGTPYTTVHPTWSTEFLAYLCETAGERAAHRRVGRCLTAILALAADPERRETVNWRLHGQTPYLGRITTDPQAWAETVVRQVFAVGREHADLAPLFGTTEYSRITLPDVCPPALHLRCAEWRGQMSIDAGRLDRAEQEFTQLAEAAAEVDAPEATAVQARSYRYLGKIAQKRGAFDAAEVALQRGLEFAQDADAPQLEADCLHEWAGVEWMRGTFDAATERRLERALTLYRDLGAVDQEIKLLQNLGLIQIQRGQFDAAHDQLDRSLVLARELDATREQVSGLQNLGHLAYRQGDLDTADQRWTHALTLARDTGHKQAEAVLLNNLGEVAREREAYATADEYYHESLALADQIDAQKSVARAYTNLALLALAQDDPDTAAEHATKSLELRRSMNDHRGEAATRRVLARVALAAGDHDEAHDHVEQSRELAQTVDDPYLEAKTLRVQGAVAAARGAHPKARDVLTEAATVAADIGAARVLCESVAVLHDVCGALDDQATLRDWVTTARDVVDDVGIADQSDTLPDAIPLETGF